jgi:adenosylcobinamide amidohydrolase
VGRAAAVAAVEVLRRGQRAQVEIAAGAGLRYALGMEAGGVEIRARASPELERAARADLCAVANELRRRGVRLARAEVRLAPPGGSGGPGRR